MQTSTNDHDRANDRLASTLLAGQPDLLDPRSGAMVFDELSGRLVSVPLGAFAAAVARLITGRPLPVASAASAEEPALEPEPVAAPPRARRRRAPRVEREILAAGTKLVHRQGGRVVARATVTDAGTVVYDKKSYRSVSAAANAAAEALGQKSRTLNGWVFWGLKKRVK